MDYPTTFFASFEGWPGPNHGQATKGPNNEGHMMQGLDITLKELESRIEALNEERQHHLHSQAPAKAISHAVARCDWLIYAYSAPPCYQLPFDQADFLRGNNETCG